MASQNPFLQLALNRAEKTLRRVGNDIWSRIGDLTVEASACLDTPLAWPEARTLPMHPLELPCHWGRLYQFRWFRVRLPDACPPSAYMEWKAQGQATAWVNERPYFGFDQNHRCMKVHDGMTEIWLESVCLPSFVDPPEMFSAEGVRSESAGLVLRNDQAWRAQQKLALLFELALEERMELHPAMGRVIKPVGLQPPVTVAPPLYRRLLRHLDRCGNDYDRNGIPGLDKALDRAFADLRSGSGFGLKATLSGHAHIDLVWLWPERIGPFKARHSFANALRLMDEYPEFRFQYSQGASYASVEESSQALVDEIRLRITEGRWEASGALHVESDTMLPCGEALARGFVLGQRRFQDLTGKPSRLLWLPDVFGYSGCLPQLMREFGVEYFFTTKLSWNSLNAFPLSSFRWRGDDGSEVLAHLTQEVGYNNSMQVRELRAAERSYRQADVHDEFLVPTGFGDGGGGPTPEMCERARHAAYLAGLPSVRWDVPVRFFERLAECRGELPVYRGELFFENHHGTYTTQGEIKRALRLAERALQTLEAVQVASASGEIPVRFWERVVFAQFHDYIPGSSVPPVYQEALEDLSSVAREALSLAASKLSKEGQHCWFNPLPLPLKVRLAGARILELSPLSGCPETQARPASDQVTLEDPLSLANSRIRAVLNATGFLEELSVDGEPVRLSTGAGGLWLFRDCPAHHESWDIDRQALDTGVLVDSPVEHSTGRSEDGAAWIRFHRRIGQASEMTLVYTLAPESCVLTMDISLDWREEHALLRMIFPTDYTGQMARYGSPFGSVLRPQHSGDVRSEAMWEVPGARYAIALDDSGMEGLFLLTEAKYGFSCREGCLSVSLVRSPLHTGMDGEDYERMYPKTLRTEPTVPRHTDQGPHAIRLALGRFVSTAPVEEQPAALAESVFAKALEYTGAAVVSGLLGIKSESLVPCWAQPLADGEWILRLHEVLGRHGRAQIQIHYRWLAGRCRFDGSELSPLEGPDVAFRPYEIVSLRLRRQPKTPSRR